MSARLHPHPPDANTVGGTPMPFISSTKSRRRFAETGNGATASLKVHPNHFYELLAVAMAVTQCCCNLPFILSGCLIIVKYL